MTRQDIFYCIALLFLQFLVKDHVLRMISKKQHALVKGNVLRMILKNNMSEEFAVAESPDRLRVGFKDDA